jgi:hypothetical protein
MKAPSIACLLLFLFQLASAQDKIPDFGDVDPSELNMKECSFEKGASAMNLIRTAKISMELDEFSYTLTITSEYRVRIKLFNKQGFSAANIKIPYASRGRSSRIKDLEAYIYSLDDNGKVIKKKVEKKEIFNEKSKAEKSLNFISFTFPDLYGGAVLEYRYTRIDKNSMTIQPWFFQDELPTAFSRVVTVVPAYTFLSYRTVCSDMIEKDSAYKKHYNNIYNEDIRSFTVRNIRSFRPEPLMYSLSDNLERMEFSLSPRTFLHSGVLSNEEKMRFQNFALLRSRHFGYQMNKSIFACGYLLDSVMHMTSKRDRIEAIYKYVRQNVEFNGEQTIFCDSVDACLTSRLGSSADMNILFLNLLSKAAVNCRPLLISTNDNGNPDIDFPSMSQFNGVDVLVRDSTFSYIIDCTQKHLSYDMPPFNVLNSNAYMIDPDGPGWMFILDDRILMKADASVEAMVDSAGHLNGTAKLWDIGFGKKETLDEAERKEGQSKKDDSPENELTSGLTIDSVVAEGNTSIGDTLVRRLQFHYEPSRAGDFYFINPLLFFGFKKNPFVDSVRYSDIDFGCAQSFSNRMRIKLPGNFSVESLPGDLVIHNPDSSLSYTRRVYMQGRSLIIEYSFLCRRSIFIKEEYASVKSFFDKFYANQNQDIPIRKVK